MTTLKNTNGYYEFPSNLQGNPLNEDVSTFTTGQINDHVRSITNELPGLVGNTPGVSNLRDFPNASEYGRKFVKHSGPIGLASYLINRKDINISSLHQFSEILLVGSGKGVVSISFIKEFNWYRSSMKMYNLLSKKYAKILLK